MSILKTITQEMMIMAIETIAENHKQIEQRIGIDPANPLIDLMQLMLEHPDHEDAVEQDAIEAERASADEATKNETPTAETTATA